MTLTDIQRLVLRTIAENRGRDSYCAGGATLNRGRARMSDDLDIFHDSEESVVAAADRDIADLRQAGFLVEERVRALGTVEAVVRQYGFETLVQWMDDTRKRFFPLVKDSEFGMRLHDTDLAINKILCASSRRQARDFVDLVEIARECPLGPLIWAAASKSAFGPGRIIEEIRKNAGSISSDEFRTVRMAAESEVDTVKLLDSLEAELRRAERYVTTIAPEDEPGALFVDANGKPIEADRKMMSLGLASARRCNEFEEVLPRV
jgi:hypothetical protein